MWKSKWSIRLTHQSRSNPEPEAFVERAKHTQSVRLTQPHYNEILSRIHDHLWNSGKRVWLCSFMRHPCAGRS